MCRLTSILCEFLRSLCSVSVSKDPDGRHGGGALRHVAFQGSGRGRSLHASLSVRSGWQLRMRNICWGPQSSSGVEILPQSDPSPHVSPSPPLTQLTNQARSWSTGPWCITHTHTHTIARLSSGPMRHVSKLLCTLLLKHTLLLVR